MKRNLDGVFFRVKRANQWENICFSDMTDKEMDSILLDKDGIYLRSMCKILGRTIREIGDELDLVKEM